MSPRKQRIESNAFPVIAAGSEGITARRCWLPLIALALLSMAGPQAVGRVTQSQPQAPVKLSLEGLLYDLKSPEAFRRRQAVELLGDKKIVTAVPELIKLWDDPDLEVRRALVRALENIGDARAAEPLSRMFPDLDKEIRRNSIRAVTAVYLKSGTPAAGGAGNRMVFWFTGGDNPEDRIVEPYVPVSQQVIQALGKRLEDEDKDIRTDAAKALGTLQGREVIPAMVHCLKIEQEKEVLLALIRAFAKIGDRGVAGELIPLAYREDKAIHDEAISTLGMLGNPVAVPDLTKLFESDAEQRRKLFRIIPLGGSSDDLQIRAFSALSGIGSAKSKKHFSEAVGHADPKYRQAAAEGLARVSESDSVTVVSSQRMIEKRESARMAQSFALFRMGRREYLEDLIRGIEDGNEQAFGYLLEFRPAEIFLLYPFLESSSARVRARIAEALGWIGDANSLKRLDALAADTNADVLASSVLATRRINARIARYPKAPQPAKR